MEQKKSSKSCEHIDQINPDITAKTPQGCEECLQTGDSWVNLRLCLTCGHVGCCESSKNMHALKHFQAAKHPIMQAYKQEGQNWKYCYIDELYIEA